MISRFEYNMQNGQRVEIAQVIYKNAEGEVIMLDVGDQPPEGFEEFTGDMEDLNTPASE